MNRAAIIRRVRAYTRDLNSTIFRLIDVTDFMDEGIDRISSYVPEFKGMTYLADDAAVPILLPTSHHYLIALFSAARCFAQDERHYQATTLMNEFEMKLDELKFLIEAGDIVIKDALGVVVTGTIVDDHVTDVYFNTVSDEDEFLTVGTTTDDVLDGGEW